MDDPDAFNSSDIEVDILQHPFSWAGRDSIQAIIKNATEDRISSKKFTKQLTYTKGRQGTQYRNQL